MTDSARQAFDLRRLTDLTLASGTVDRASHLRVDRDWLSARWADLTTRVVAVADGRVPVDEAGGALAVRWVAPTAAPDGERYLLGVDSSDVAYFAVRVDELPPGPSADLRRLGMAVSRDEAQLITHAVALANWHEAHRRCPRCGAPTEVVSAGAERLCTADESLHFPRTDPAVIVLVTDPDGRALLGRQESWPEGRYSTLAGFVEPGESAEQAVVREVAEESHVQVTDVTFLASQPWPFPASLMLGFSASATRQAAVPDGDELSEVRWFSRAEYRAGIASGAIVAPSGISISRRLIERWYGEPLIDGPPGAVWR